MVTSWIHLGLQFSTEGSLSCHVFIEKPLCCFATTLQLLWLRQLIRGLGVIESSPPLLFCNTQAAMHIASNATFHECTNILKFTFHFVQDKVADGLLKLMPICLQDQNVFTKPFPNCFAASSSFQDGRKVVHVEG